MRHPPVGGHLRAASAAVSGPTGQQARLTGLRPGLIGTSSSPGEPAPAQSSWYVTVDAGQRHLPSLRRRRAVAACQLEL